tara:strand:+ start:1719 stop:1937 length:219 start_codon:yes stop_codon:yes gene_type:complete
MPKTNHSKPQLTIKSVRIVVNNVWAAQCKFYREDIVALPVKEADSLISYGAAKETKDDVTAAINADGNRVDV